MCGDFVDWHFDAELISAVFLCIIWLYSYETNMVVTLKNLIFRGYFVAAAVSILANALCLPLELSGVEVWSPLMVGGYYLHAVSSPFTTVIWQLYTLAFVYEGTGRNIRRPIAWSLLPYGVYLIILGSNPFNRLLFTLDAGGTLTYGSLFQLVYVVQYVYCAMMVYTVLITRKIVARDARQVIISFPFLIAAFTLLQQLMPNVVLDGSQAVCVLLLAYLYLQNKRIYEDQLTGLPNRSAYIKTLQVLLDKKSTIIVMSISLNEFKFINDKFGQENGDLLLKGIADFLKSVLPLSKVYRCGGDKFAVIFEKSHLDTAGEDICRIADRFQLPWDIPDCTCHLGAAIGVAHCPNTADNMRELVSTLESAVERAKILGSAQPVFCDHGIIEQVRRKHHVKDLLNNALRTDGFEIYFQPLFSIQENRFTEAEALLRLRDENGKFLSPEEFIPIAEEAGLIVDIGYLVVDKVCKYIRELLQCGVNINTVSINLSVVQLMKVDIVPRILQIIRGNGICPSRIILEVTESILVSNYSVAADKIRKLSEAGIRFALDDFGTGYSNLTHVIDLPFHMIKIDKSLIWDSMTNQKCYILIRDLTKTFENMNFLVIAEGVETTEHDEFVRLCGCDRIQGYRYARPMPSDRASAYLGKSLAELKE